MKRLYRILVTLESVAYLDTDDVDSHEHGDTYMPRLFRQWAEEYGNGITPTRFKATKIRNANHLPEGWDDGCVPFGKQTYRSIERILSDIKEGKEDG